MDGSPFRGEGSRIPIEQARKRGWGKSVDPWRTSTRPTTIHYFVFGKPQPRRTLIVSGDPQTVAAMQLAATISPDPAFNASASNYQ